MTSSSVVNLTNLSCTSNVLTSGSLTVDTTLLSGGGIITRSLTCNTGAIISTNLTAGTLYSQYCNSSTLASSQNTNDDRMRADQTISNGVLTTVNYTTGGGPNVLYNVNGATIGSPSITVPVSGYWLVTYMLCWDPNAPNFPIVYNYLSINSSTSNCYGGEYISDNHPIAGGVAIVPLTTSDTLRVMCYQNQGNYALKYYNNGWIANTEVGMKFLFAL